MENDSVKEDTLNSQEAALDGTETNEQDSNNEDSPETKPDIQESASEKHEVVATDTKENSHSNEEGNSSKDQRHNDEETKESSALSLEEVPSSNELITDPRFLGHVPPMPRKLLPIYPETPCQFPQERERGLSIVREKVFQTKHICTALLLTLLITPYLVGGAWLFSFLEEEQEVIQMEELSKLKNDTAILLATELRQVKANEPTWARYVFKYLDIFEKELLKASGVRYWRKDQLEKKRRWSNFNSFFYSLSLVTTTGYGSMTPRSEWGRTATVCYSLFGVPLMLGWLISSGYVLAVYWSWMFKNLCCHLCGTDKNTMHIRKSRNQQSGLKKKFQSKRNSVAPVKEDTVLAHSQRNPEPKVNGALYNTEHKLIIKYDQDVPRTLDMVSLYPTMRRAFKSSVAQIQSDMENKLMDLDHAVATVFSVLFFFVYFVFGSVIFALTEEWTITDTLYFNFLLFLTMGPGCYEVKDDLAEIKMKQNVYYIVFLVLGYCIMSMIFNLIFMFFNLRRTIKTEPSKFH